MTKTRTSFFGRIAQMLGGTDIDDETWDDVEALLIQADVGVDTTQIVLEDLKQRVRRENITRTDQNNMALKASLASLLKPPPQPNTSGRPLTIIL
ncbi:MAG: signal recognition particle receptor subunit alpha, partial [Anaerolineae bacterium]|nr:signal recognition particle receptor subunit alpha [Anaerolineae bacterium]